MYIPFGWIPMSITGCNMRPSAAACSAEYWTVRFSTVQGRTSGSASSARSHRRICEPLPSAPMTTLPCSREPSSQTTMGPSGVISTDDTLLPSCRYRSKSVAWYRNTIFAAYRKAKLDTNFDVNILGPQPFGFLDIQSEYSRERYVHQRFLILTIAENDGFLLAFFFFQ